MSRQTLGSSQSMAAEAVEYKEKVRRTWHGQSSPEGNNVPMALAWQQDGERQVHTRANA